MRGLRRPAPCRRRSARRCSTSITVTAAAMPTVRSATTGRRGSVSSVDEVLEREPAHDLPGERVDRPERRDEQDRERARGRRSQPRQRQHQQQCQPRPGVPVHPRGSRTLRCTAVRTRGAHRDLVRADERGSGGPVADDRAARGPDELGQPLPSSSTPSTTRRRGCTSRRCDRRGTSRSGWSSSRRRSSSPRRPRGTCAQWSLSAVSAQDFSFAGASPNHSATWALTSGETM